MSNNLSFSVVIPTYKREESLKVTLLSVLTNTLKPQSVVIIDDDCVSDKTLHDFQKRFINQKINFIYKNKKSENIPVGLSESKNWAVSLVQSDIICFIDDDVELKESYFFELMSVWEKNFDDAKLFGIGGKVLNSRPISIFEKYFRKFFGLSSKNTWDVNPVGFQVWDTSIKNVELGYYIEGCASSYRREYLKHNLFLVFSGGRTALEDVEHCLRLKKLGYYFLYAPDAQILHFQLPVGRDKAFLAGQKEGLNRRKIFVLHSKKDLKHYLWFLWANIGWLIKKIAAFKFKEFCGMGYGLFNFFDSVISNESLFGGHTVEIYDSKVAIALAVNAFKTRKTTVYISDSIDAHDYKEIIIRNHLMSSAPALTQADVCMLDGDSLKVLAVKYPSDSRYVLARLAFRRGWFFGIPGLIRRAVLGRVKLGGVVTVKDFNNKKTRWLLIKRTKNTNKQDRLLLSKEVGVVGFLEWLRVENIKYVVPRFYENLPALHRDGGDLDLLVANEDVEKVKNFLHSTMRNTSSTNDDSIPIGLHSISRAQGLPYYPPPIAKRIINRGIDGPAGSKIPAPDDALNALIYHVLYHGKGYATSIPSVLGGKPEHVPENDYGFYIKQKATALGLKVGETMEELDEYMARIGWRPKKDTLAKIAERNAWVRDRFFTNRDIGGTGLTVFILKEKALHVGIFDDVVKHFREEGLRVLHEIVFTDEQKKLATEHVRGGNWVGPSGTSEGLLPAAMIIAIDPKCANLPPAYAHEYERLWSKKRKGKLRAKFDRQNEPSIVHAADNTIEAWEYIEFCIPNHTEEIRKNIETSVKVSFLTKISRFCSITYILHTLKFKIRDFITKRL